MGGREGAYLESQSVNIVIYLDNVGYAAEYGACSTRRGRIKGSV